MPRQRLGLGQHGLITVRATKSSPKAKRNDQWIARARVRDTDGVIRLIERSSAKSEEDARRTLQDALQDRSAPIRDRKVAPTTELAALFTLWLDTKSNPNVAGYVLPQSQSTYRDVWERYGAKQLGNLRVCDVDTPLLASHLSDVAGRSTPQAKQLRVVLTGMFTTAVENGAVQVNPVRETRRPQKPKGKRNDSTKPLTVEEVQLLRSVIARYREAVNRPGPKPGANLLAWLDLMAATGARPNEVLALRWEDVDLLADVPTVTISGTIVDAGAAPYRQDFRKDYAPDLTIALPAFAVETLTEMFSVTGPDGLVFCDRDGGIVRLGNLRRALRAAVKDTDLDRVYPHLVRKTVATLIEREEGLTAASHQLGHAGEAVTAAHYVERRTVAPDHRNVLDQLGA